MILVTIATFVSDYATTFPNRPRFTRGATNCGAHTGGMETIRASVLGWPVLGRFVFLGALVAGIAGCIAGLIVGLCVYPPTAAFALFELGIPATFAGAIVGFLSGALRLGLRRVSQYRNGTR
jgi:hypothetical protein